MNIEEGERDGREMKEDKEKKRRANRVDTDREKDKSDTKRSNRTERSVPVFRLSSWSPSEAYECCATAAHSKSVGGYERHKVKKEHERG